MKPQPWTVIQRSARNALSDARDWLASDWPSGQGPDDREADGRVEAMLHIDRAKNSLDGGRSLVWPDDLPDGWSLTVTREYGQFDVGVFDNVERIQGAGRGRTLDQAVREALADVGEYSSTR